MTPSSTCPSCGNALTKDRGGNLCPACLLRAALRSDPVMESLATAPREALGSTIGRYKLLEEIGEGGFGIVYMAEQTEPVKRRAIIDRQRDALFRSSLRTGTAASLESP